MPHAARCSPTIRHRPVIGYRFAYAAQWCVEKHESVLVFPVFTLVCALGLLADIFKMRTKTKTTRAPFPMRLLPGLGGPACTRADDAQYLAGFAWIRRALLPTRTLRALADHPKHAHLQATSMPATAVSWNVLSKLCAAQYCSSFPVRVLQNPLE